MSSIPEGTTNIGCARISLYLLYPHLATPLEKYKYEDVYREAEQGNYEFLK